MALAVVPTTSDALESGVGAPVWWLRRLHETIISRRSGLMQVRRYYKGDFEWKYADAELRKAFGHVFYESRMGVNWMKLIVNGVAERLKIYGIRVDQATGADSSAWDIWKAARLPARSAKVHRHSLLYGASYVTVWPDSEGEPAIKVDHPAMAAVEIDPDDETNRLAGLRMYLDVGGFMHAQLFLPDTVYLYRSHAPVTQQPQGAERVDMSWMVDDAEVEDGQMHNPLGVVPMVPFLNEPSADWPGEADGRFLIERSELHGVMPIQDAINSVLFNVLLVANTQGYKQRWVTGLEIEKDDQGNVLPPFKADINRIWQAESDQTKFGDFATTDVTPLLNLIDQLVRNLASVSQIPPHMLEPQADRLSADSIRASESGLIMKIQDKQTINSDGWTEVLRLAGELSKNSKLADGGATVMWVDPETNTLAALYDSGLKSVNIGVPWEERMAKLGYSPDDIKRLKKQREDDAKLQQPVIDSIVNTRLMGQPASVDPSEAGARAGAPKPPLPNELPAPGQGSSQ
jgi:hypothetical protein